MIEGLDCESEIENYGTETEAAAKKESRGSEHGQIWPGHDEGEI